MVKFDIKRKYTLEQLRDSVAGKTNFIPRTIAIKILSGSEVQNKYEDFRMILENKNEPSNIRYLAAISLGRIGNLVVKEILTKSIQSEVDERVFVAIVTALGRIGDEHSLHLILKAKERMIGSAKSQAEFAISLISYRLGLKGNDLSFPNEQDFLNVSANSFQMQFSDASDEEIKISKLSLISEPFGIEIAERPAFQVKYDRGVGIALFNREFVGEQVFQTLLKRKALLGLFADKSQEFGTYSVTYLIFSSPDSNSNKINILVTRPDGVLVYGGIARITQTKDVDFSLRAISQLGNFAILLEGIIKDKNLRIKTAQFSTSIQNNNQPQELNI